VVPRSSHASLQVLQILGLCHQYRARHNHTCLVPNQHNHVFQVIHLYHHRCHGQPHQCAPSPFTVITNMTRYHDQTCLTSTTCRHLPSSHTRSSQCHTIIIAIRTTRSTRVNSISTTSAGVIISKGGTGHQAKQPPATIASLGGSHCTAKKCFNISLFSSISNTNRHQEDHHMRSDRNWWNRPSCHI
jgi:hypothetical protein